MSPWSGFQATQRCLAVHALRISQIWLLFSPSSLLSCCLQLFLKQSLSPCCDKHPHTESRMPSLQYPLLFLCLCCLKDYCMSWEFHVALLWRSAKNPAYVVGYYLENEIEQNFWHQKSVESSRVIQYSWNSHMRTKPRSLRYKSSIEELLPLQAQRFVWRLFP